MSVDLEKQGKTNQTKKSQKSSELSVSGLRNLQKGLKFLYQLVTIVIVGLMRMKMPY